jgi:exopolysaccharide production protein ExoQ
MRAASRHRFFYIGTTLLCAIVGFLSKSGTSLLTILFLYVFNLIGRFYIKGGISRIVSIGAALFVTGAFVLLMLNMDLIYSLLDKDPTLSGRTELWPYVIDYVYQRPVLGWGFTAFWMLSNPPAGEIMSAVGFPLNEAITASSNCYSMSASSAPHSFYSFG